MEWRFNPLWVRLDQVTHEEFGIENLYLVSGGRRVGDREFPGPGRKGQFCQGA